MKLLSLVLSLCLVAAHEQAPPANLFSAAERDAMILNLTQRVMAQMTWPGATWERVRPENAGMDPVRVAQAVEYGRGRGIGDESFCVSIHRNGRLVADGYWNLANYRSTHIIWSVSKAFVATLIGIAEHRGRLQTSSFVRTWITQWNSVLHPSYQVTVDQILRHNSGRYYDPITDFVTPQNHDDQTIFSLSLSQSHTPGTVDQYNQMAFQLLERVLAVATGQPVRDFTAQQLFTVLQFESPAFWQMMSFFIGRPQQVPPIYGGITCSCADLGRFGHLWLNQGNWRGNQVFPVSFWEKSMAQPRMPNGNFARKYGNWGDNGNSTRSNGLGNQVVFFNRANGLVGTRIGFPTSTSNAFSYNIFMERLVAAITDMTPAEKQVAEDQWYIG